MPDMFQGVAAPDVNTTKTTASVAPQYITDYYSDIAAAGKTAMGRDPSQMVAPLTNLQNQGYAAVPGAATAYQPGLASAQQTAGMAAQGMSPEAIQSFMNPYTSNVVDEMGRLQQQNVQRNLMPQLKAGFVGTGGLGSTFRLAAVAGISCITPKAFLGDLALGLNPLSALTIGSTKSGLIPRASAALMTLPTISSCSSVSFEKSIIDLLVLGASLFLAHTRSLWLVRQGQQERLAYLRRQERLQA